MIIQRYTVFVGAFCALAALAKPVSGQPVGTAFSYQGQLKAGGKPVSDTCNFEFDLYDAATGGSQVGNTISKNGVDVTQGLFGVTLDFGENRFTGDARWLQVSVQCPGDTGYTALSPRQELTPAPYALALPAVRTQHNPVCPAVIGGWKENEVLVGVEAGTIGGGGDSSYPNRVTDAGGTVGGGAGNTAGNNNGALFDAEFATVAGGRENTANAYHATVGGGYRNIASAVGATVSGGWGNMADSDFATVGGGEGNVASNSWATVGGGYSNEAWARATVAGGYNNNANSNGASIGGGENNVASGSLATVGGGEGNMATKTGATIAGGYYNNAGIVATVAGGYNNSASSDGASIGGGENNVANGVSATVSGGWQNTADGEYATVGGGDHNVATNGWATIGGGYYNDAGIAATVAGGYNNSANSNGASIGGGQSNVASGAGATVCGGAGNHATALMSTVPGGSGNVAAGAYSFAAGQSAKADHDGTFVWADTSTTNDFHSTDINQFLIRAQGGVGIGTDNPGGTLEVAGPPGDSAVILPIDAIAAAERLDEPGVASERDGGSVYLDGTNQTLLSQSIDCPATGYVLAIGTCLAALGHQTTYHSSAGFAVTNDVATVPSDRAQVVQLWASIPAGTYYFSVTSQAVFEVSAGQHEFYLLGWGGAGPAGAVWARNMQLSLVYIPTAYGDVATEDPRSRAPQVSDRQPDLHGDLMSDSTEMKLLQSGSKKTLLIEDPLGGTERVHASARARNAEIADLTARLERLEAALAILTEQETGGAE